MPQWLRIMPLAAGLLIGAVFLAELVLAIAAGAVGPRGDVAAGEGRTEMPTGMSSENAMTESS